MQKIYQTMKNCKTKYKRKDCAAVLPLPSAEVKKILSRWNIMYLLRIYSILIVFEKADML